MGQQGRTPSGGSTAESTSLLLQLLHAFLGSWPLPPLHGEQWSTFSHLCFHRHSSPSYQMLLHPSYQDLCIYTGPPRDFKIISPCQGP